jgi:hypothetical protein
MERLARQGNEPVKLKFSNDGGDTGFVLSDSTPYGLQESVTALSLTSSEPSCLPQSERLPTHATLFGPLWQSTQYYPDLEQNSYDEMYESLVFPICLFTDRLETIAVSREKQKPVDEEIANGTSKPYAKTIATTKAIAAVLKDPENCESSSATEDITYNAQRIREGERWQDLIDVFGSVEILLIGQPTSGYIRPVPSIPSYIDESKEDYFWDLTGFCPLNNKLGQAKSVRMPAMVTYAI